jgi:hypothetical protein
MSARRARRLPAKVRPFIVCARSFESLILPSLRHPVRSGRSCEPLNPSEVTGLLTSYTPAIKANFRTLKSIPVVKEGVSGVSIAL